MVAAVAADFSGFSRLLSHVRALSLLWVAFSMKTFSKTLQYSSGHQWESDQSVTDDHHFVGFVFQFTPAYGLFDS